MHVAGAGLAAAIAALTIAACGGSSHSTTAHTSAHTSTSSAGTSSQASVSSDAAGLGTIVEAAAHSSEAAGEKIALDLSIDTSALGTIGLSGTGVFDNSTREGHSTLSLSAGGSSGGGLLGSLLDGAQVAVAVHDTTVYLELPSEVTELLSTYTGGRPWIAANLLQLAKNKSYGGLADLLNAEGGLTNPVGALESLTKNGVQGVTKQGSATVNGVPCTVYVADVNVAGLESSLPAADRAQLAKVAGISKIPYSVYIDSSGQIRRISFSVTPEVAGASGKVSVAMDVLSYGAQPATAVPPAGETTSFTALLAKLG